MAIIRVAIVGLSANAKTAWAAAGHLPYLLSARGRKSFKVTALLNSSTEAAQKAIEKYFPNETGIKAYGNPDDLAADPEVDLVVTSTRVDTHYAATLPSIKAGKVPYIEWPLAQDVKHAEELQDAVGANGKSIVGLQGRYVPLFEKVKVLIDEGKIGKVLSSELRAFGGTVDRETLTHKLDYFTDKSIGGNPITIGFAHLFDQIQSVLGDVSDIRSVTQIQRPVVKFIDDKGAVVHSESTNVPDLLHLSGRLADNATAVPDATVSVYFRRGQPFKGQDAFTWTVNGEKGEIRLTARNTTFLGGQQDPGEVHFQVHDHATDELKDITAEWKDWQNEFDYAAAKAIADVYERYLNNQPVPTFAEAVELHRKLEQILQ